LWRHPSTTLFPYTTLFRSVRADSAIGIKPMSRFGTERLLRKAIRYAEGHGLPSVTLVHKGNIMKFTEGAFRDWGYGLAAREFARSEEHTSELQSRENLVCR